MKNRTFILLLLGLVALVAVMTLMNYTGTSQASEPFSKGPKMTWVREFPKPLGHLPEGRIPSCRNTERYECGLLCGYTYDGGGDVSTVVCVPYWFKMVPKS